MTVLKDRSGATVGSNEYSGEMSVGFDYTGLQPDNETITYRWPHPPPASFAFRLNFDTLEHLMFFQVEYAEQITDIQGQKGHAFELIFDSLPYLQENDTMIVPSKVYPANLSTDAFVSVFHSGPYTEFGEKWDSGKVNDSVAIRVERRSSSAFVRETVPIEPITTRLEGSILIFSNPARIEDEVIIVNSAGQLSFNLRVPVGATRIALPALLPPGVYFVRYRGYNSRIISLW